MRSSIADYEVLKRLGEAGEGASRYLCRAPARLDRDEPVEVREIRLGPGRWPQWSDLVMRVAGAAAPELRVMFEAGSDPAGLGAFLSCENVQGDLAGPVEPVGDPEALSRVAAVAAAARGAHALHEVGIAHGSICPAAIVFSARGPVLDVPRLDSPAGFTVRADDRTELATVDPDLLRGETPSRSSDVWSLGASLHAALSDRPLYPGLAGDQAVTAVQRVLFTRPQIDPDLQADVRAVIVHCLAPDPAERPETAAQVADALAGIEVVQ